MFYESYKDLFLEDKSQPFTKQLNDFKRLKFDSKAERVRNPLTLSGSNIMQNPTSFLSNETKANQHITSRHNVFSTDVGKSYDYPKTDPIKKNKYNKQNFDSINELNVGCVPNVLEFNPNRYSSSFFLKPDQKNTHSNIFSSHIDNSLVFGHREKSKANQEKFPSHNSKKLPKRVNFIDNGRNQLENDSYIFTRDEQQNFNSKRYENKNINQHKIYQKSRGNIYDLNQSYNSLSSRQNFKNVYNPKEPSPYFNNRIYGNYQEPSNDQSEYQTNRNYAEIEDSYNPTKIDPYDFDRDPSKNQITYDFLTGTNYEKEGHISAQTGERNQSQKIFQVFDRKNNIQTSLDKMVNETDLQKFKRDLTDARRMNMPKSEAESQFKMAKTIVPPQIYENFMLNSMGNPKRIQDFQRAINRRVEMHSDESRKSRLVEVIQGDLDKLRRR